VVTPSRCSLLRHSLGPLGLLPVPGIAGRRASATVSHCHHQCRLPDPVAAAWALDRDEQALPRLRFTLGGEEYPFQIYGYSEHRPNRELGEVILAQPYREAGWRVEWGPEFMSEKDGYVRTFRLTNVPETLGQEGVVRNYVATIGIKIHTVSGTYEKSLVKLIKAEDDQKATYYALRSECHREPGHGMEWETGGKAIDASGELEYSVKSLVLVSEEDVATLQKYVAGW